MKRRAVLVASLTALPAFATPDTLRAAIDAFAAGSKPPNVRDGRITLEIAPLIDNGNVVPVTLRVTSPMTAADHVQRIALLTELNPAPDVAVFHLGPRAGRAVVATRIRLATSQRIVALARMSDGSVWQATADVIVTLAACIET